MTGPALATIDVAALQRRTVRTLVVAQAVGALGITIGIATASLLAAEISGSEKLAGLAQTSQVLGAAVAAYLLARLMARYGRRIGLAVGTFVGASGSLLVVASGVLGSMVLLLVGCALLGAMTAANMGARYAATDLAEDAHRGRALAVVVWSTTIGAVLGPNLAGPAGDIAVAWGLPRLTGPFALGTLGMLAASVVLLVFLRPDPLLTARSLAAETEPPEGTSWGRVVAVVRARPVVGAAIAGLALAHAVMIAVMVMTPLHMEHGGAELHVIGYVISLHVLGMFAFSPLVGIAADRLGRGPVLGAGGVVLLLSLLLSGFSPEGSSVRIFAGLFLLGLGWSLATVAASTLLTEHAPLAARTDVQGAADLIMGLTAAAAGALAGLIVGSGGYGWLNGFAALLATGVVVAAVAAVRLLPRPETVAP